MIISPDHRRLQGEFDLAEKYTKDSIQYFHRMGDRKLEGLGYFRLAILNKSMKNLDLALRDGQISQELLEIAKAQFAQVDLFIFMGDVYLELHQHSEAKAIWQNGLKLANKQNHPRLKVVEERLSKL